MTTPSCSLCLHRLLYLFLHAEIIPPSVILSDGRRTVRAVFQQVAAAHGLTDAAADGAVAAPLLTSSAAAAAGIPRAGASGRESSALITSALNPMETSESVRVQPSVGSIVQLDAFVVERRPTSASGLGDDEPFVLALLRVAQAMLTPFTSSSQNTTRPILEACRGLPR